MKILIITKHLLDLRDAQSQQSFALISALSEVFARVDVICGQSDESDESELNYIKKNSKNNCKFHALKAVWIIGGGGLTNKIYRKIQRNLLAIIQSDWEKSASKFANELNEINNYALVLTIGLPIESHMVGLNLKNNNRWISAFSDPWPESIMPRPYSDYSLKVVDCFQKRVVQKIIAQSRALIFTCSQSIELFRKNYCLELGKCFVMPHIAPPKVAGKFLNKEGEVVVTYSGSLSRERFFPELFLAISDLPKNSSLKFQFIGYVHPAAVKLIKDLGIGSRIVLMGQLTKENTLSILGASQILMSIEAEMEVYPFLPSKIADYASFGLPIFAITGKESATAEIIKINDAGYVLGYRRMEILEGLINLEKNYSKKANFSLYDVFDRDKIKKQYIELAMRICKS